MIGALLTRIAGPRVLVGVVAASVICIASLSWLLLDAKQDQGAAESRANTAESANQAWKKAWTEQQSEIKAQTDALNAIDRRLSMSEKRSQRRLSKLDAGLRDAISESKEVRNWASSRRPDAVIERLCIAGYIDPAARPSMCGDSGEAD